VLNNRKFNFFTSSIEGIESKNNSSAFDPEKLKNKKIHPAIEYFHRLQTSAPSIHLKKFLSSFDEPRAIDSETFAEGVKKFIMLANSNPLGSDCNSRKALYENIYSGLHYNNDLVKLWNSSHLENPIQASHVLKLVPHSWSSVQDNYITLIYRGQQPAEALDQLVMGPTVIDCGMFTQLSLWFGIRYVLGNERFNQCFGRAPFFITQIVYNEIENSNQPYTGNPLYSFLSNNKERSVSPSVTVKHITNTSLYPLKHPGGNYGGDNCILIGKQYYIFDPHLEDKDVQGISESAVLNLLRHAFNEERLQYDIDRLSLYASSPEEFHPKLFKTYGQLIAAADSLRDKKLTEEEFLEVKQNPSLELTFDLQTFSNWLKMMENNLQPEKIEYLPKPIDYSIMPIELLSAIPFENKTSMDFSKFKQEVPQQKELVAISKQFCQSIMANESKLVILTGKAGVGKTASAVCAAKELVARGKKVVWISEVMVTGWADQAKSIADLDNCGLAIDKLLATDPDAIFLDDDNLAGFSGNLLLEKIYSWYVEQAGKGLFITSNEPICFDKCYGYKLDGQYHYPPFCHYNSSQYINWQHKTDLNGKSLRSKCDGQSIGAIVSDLVWKMNESKLGDIELIPGFDDKNELVPIRQSLRKTGSMGSAYDKLRPIQKRWIHTHEAGGIYIFFGARSKYEEPYLTANPSKFEKTTCKTIALEIREYKFYDGINIHPDSMDQLIRILNYAHDQGGRRVILINQTSFNTQELLIKVKENLPSSERERTWSRLMLLLCETEDSIFKHDQFNGRIENASPEKKPVTNNRNELHRTSLFKKRFRRILTEFKDNRLSPDSFLQKEHACLRTNKNKKMLRKKDDESAIRDRHEAELQHMHDKRYGLVLYKDPLFLASAEKDNKASSEKKATPKEDSIIPFGSVVSFGLHASSAPQVPQVKSGFSVQEHRAKR
jgi:hypothetical protein